VKTGNLDDYKFISGEAGRNIMLDETIGRE
jgi:hypothetical protein